MFDTLDKIISCHCYSNPECAYCEGSGFVLESSIKKLKPKAYSEYIESKKSDNEERAELVRLLKQSDKALPTKLGFLITEYTRTNQPSERAIFTNLQTEHSTIDYAIGNAISKLYNAIDSIYDNKKFKNQTFYISLITDGLTTKLNDKPYKRFSINLLNDILFYFKKNFNVL